MKYAPRKSPAVDELDDLVAWIEDELSQIEQAFNEQDLVKFTEINVAPAKPRTGDTRLADGTNWNPGSGAGVYTYYGAAWHRLG